MTFFEIVLAIIGTALIIALVIMIGYAVMGTNERFYKSPRILQIFIALIIGGAIFYFILKAARSCHRQDNLDFIIADLSSI
jgi:predicted membrane protein